MNNSSAQAKQIVGKSKKNRRQGAKQFVGKPQSIRRQDGNNFVGKPHKIRRQGTNILSFRIRFLSDKENVSLVGPRTSGVINRTRKGNFASHNVARWVQGFTIFSASAFASTWRRQADMFKRVHSISRNTRTTRGQSATTPYHPKEERTYLTPSLWLGFATQLK